MFRLIGLHPGPDISAHAAASLAGVPISKVRHLLAELARTNLLTEHRPGRYACHDLLSAYAAEQADASDTEDDRHAALQRMLVHYIHSANNADAFLNPNRKEPAELTRLLPGVSAETMVDNDQALAWFTAERRVLLNAIRQTAEYDPHVWDLVWTMQRFLSHQGHWHDMLTVFSTAAAAAQRLGDPGKQAFAHSQLGCTHVWFDKHEDASRYLDIALELYRAAGDQVGQGYVEHHHAWNLDRQGRNVEALAHAEKALEHFRAAEHQAGQAKLLNALGWFHALLEDYEVAIGFCQDAIELQTAIDDKSGAAQTWHSLGYVHDRLGEHSQAISCFEKSILLCRESGYLFIEALTLSSLGDTHDNVGNPEAASAAWQRSVEILDRLGHPDADGIRAKLTRPTK
jgi:tetratricopeptide (TPR) repeat protein